MITPLDAWKEAVPDVLGSQSNRTVDEYIKIVSQFDVVNNPRYKPSKLGFGATYCNIFLWDVTKAFGCEIPHWIDLTGARCDVGKGKEQNANRVCDWLDGYGFQYAGWMLVSEQTAIQRVNTGHPTVTVWKNTAGIGHVAVIMPSTTTTLIAQAGSHNLYNAKLANGFGIGRTLKFYTHE